MNAAKIGYRIKQRREELGLTQEHLAVTLGLNKSSVQRYESGQVKKIKLPILETIAQCLNVNPDWLACKTDIQTEYETPIRTIDEVDIFQDDNTFPITLTPHETKVITAYRDKPEMQPAVDTLLGITSDEEYYIPVAARNGKSGMVKVTSSPEERKAALDKELPGVSTPKKPDVF